MGFVVVYDACVLYPAPVRDLLMEIAISDLVQAKWTERIHQEWMTSLLKDRPEINERIQQTRRLMDTAIPDALVTHYESLIDGITLPDPRDRHVVAAAVKCSAQMIVTANLKDFPQDRLAPYGLESGISFRLRRSSQSKPCIGLHDISFRHAYAVTNSQISLCQGVTLLGGQPEPVCSCNIVLCDT